MCCTSIRSKPPPAPAEELADGGDVETNKLQDDMPVYDFPEQLTQCLRQKVIVSIWQSDEGMIGRPQYECCGH